MGFLDFLFGKSSKSQKPDRVWLTENAKYQGICRSIDEELERGFLVIIVAHFPACLRGFRSILHAKTLNYEMLEDGTSIPNVVEDRGRESNGAHVILCLSDLFTGLDADSLEKTESPPLSLVVAERHPLWSVDQKLVSVAESMAKTCQVVFHLSLDDPVIKVFCGDWVVSMLRNLGMQDDEALESAMVSRRIHRTLKKFYMESFVATRADSAEEWLQQNCPQLLNEES